MLGRNDHIAQTTLERVRLLEQRISFLEKKVATDGRESGAVLSEINGKCHRCSRKRFQSFQGNALKTINDLGLATEQIDALTPQYFGTGVHYAIVEITPEHADHPQCIFQTADLQLEQEKKAGTKWGPTKMERDVQRLLAICAENGVEAVLPEVNARPELLDPLAKACFENGLTSAGQYLFYLATPYPHD